MSLNNLPTAIAQSNFYLSPTIPDTNDYDESQSSRSIPDPVPMETSVKKTETTIIQNPVPRPCENIKNVMQCSPPSPVMQRPPPWHAKGGDPVPVDSKLLQEDDDEEQRETANNIVISVRTPRRRPAFPPKKVFKFLIWVTIAAILFCGLITMWSPYNVHRVI